MKKHVLIIESNSWMSDSYKTLLETEGYSVATVSNAYSAIDAVDDNLPDVIITELLLDGGASIALLHELQSYEDTAKIPIIVCSGVQVVDETQLKPYGVVKCIDTKIMKPEQLAASIRSVLA